MKSRVPISFIFSKKLRYGLFSIFVGLCGYYIYQQRKSISQRENYTNNYESPLQLVQMLFYSLIALLFLYVFTILLRPFQLFFIKNEYGKLDVTGLFQDRITNVFPIFLITGIITFTLITIYKCWLNGIFPNNKSFLLSLTCVWICSNVYVFY